ncbi:MAG: hypothetical protein EOO64_03980 [Massilia sp.]|nr:MAG: hypothetical protein EOO64_03980 [Massilia sp.]
MANMYSNSAHFLAALITAAGLSACTAPGGSDMHAHHHPAQTAGSAGRPSADMTMGGTTGAATASGQPGAPATEGHMGPGGMDMKQMCAMHRDIQRAPDEQRQAMMDRHMQQMSPEMRQRHMEMMRQHCK